MNDATNNTAAKTTKTYVAYDTGYSGYTIAEVFNGDPSNPIYDTAEDFGINYRAAANRVDELKAEGHTVIVEWK